MERGYTVPLIIILVLAILVVPVIFWASTNSVNLSSSSPSADVRGAFSSRNGYAGNGFSVTVTSNNADTWDLVEYLCKNLEECLVSVDSGREWGIVSGGKTDLHEVVVEVPEDWKDYKYIKYFVKSGWFGDNRGFKVVSLGDAPGSEVYTISDAGMGYEVVVTPLGKLYTNFYQSAYFSD